VNINLHSDHVDLAQMLMFPCSDTKLKIAEWKNRLQDNGEADHILYQ